MAVHTGFDTYGSCNANRPGRPFGAFRAAATEAFLHICARFCLAYRWNCFCQRAKEDRLTLWKAGSGTVRFISIKQTDLTSSAGLHFSSGDFILIVNGAVYQRRARVMNVEIVSRSTATDVQIEEGLLSPIIIATFFVSVYSGKA